jgi:hypothetical protein
LKPIALPPSAPLAPSLKLPRTVPCLFFWIFFYKIIVQYSELFLLLSLSFSFSIFNMKLLGAFFVEEVVDTIVDCGAVPALLVHLQTPPPLRGENGPKLYEHEVEKGSAYALGLLAVKVKLI